MNTDSKATKPDKSLTISLATIPLSNITSDSPITSPSPKHINIHQIPSTNITSISPPPKTSTIISDFSFPIPSKHSISTTNINHPYSPPHSPSSMSKSQSHFSHSISTLAEVDELFPTNDIIPLIPFINQQSSSPEYSFESNHMIADPLYFPSLNIMSGNLCRNRSENMRKNRNKNRNTKNVTLVDSTCATTDEECKEIDIKSYHMYNISAHMKTNKNNTHNYNARRYYGKHSHSKSLQNQALKVQGTRLKYRLRTQAKVHAHANAQKYAAYIQQKVKQKKRHLQISLMSLNLQMSTPPTSSPSSYISTSKSLSSTVTPSRTPSKSKPVLNWNTMQKTSPVLLPSTLLSAKERRQSTCSLPVQLDDGDMQRTERIQVHTRSEYHERLNGLKVRLRKSTTNPMVDGGIAWKTYVGTVVFSESERGHKRYTSFNKIGEGVFARVYGTMRRKTKQLCALKVLQRGKRGSQAEISFANELMLLHSISHGNVIELYDAHVDSKYYYLEMELCKGGDLFKKIKVDGCMKESDVRHIIFTLCDIMKCFHAKGFVHRDLKPENIVFVGKNNIRNIRLIDFGEAIQVKSLENYSDFVGTECYFAPERFKRSCTGLELKKSDIWAIAVIMFEALTAHRCFVGKNSTLKLNIESRNCKWPSNLKLSKNAMEFFNNIMEIDPVKRYSALQALTHPWIIDLYRESAQKTFKTMIKQQKLTETSLDKHNSNMQTRVRRVLPTSHSCADLTNINSKQVRSGRKNSSRQHTPRILRRIHSKHRSFLLESQSEKSNISDNHQKIYEYKESEDVVVVHNTQLKHKTLDSRCKHPPKFRSKKSSSLDFGGGCRKYQCISSLMKHKCNHLLNIPQRSLPSNRSSTIVSHIQPYTTVMKTRESIDIHSRGSSVASSVPSAYSKMSNISNSNLSFSNIEENNSMAIRIPEEKDVETDGDTHKKSISSSFIFVSHAKNEKKTDLSVNINIIEPIIDSLRVAKNSNSDMEANSHILNDEQQQNSPSYSSVFIRDNECLSNM